MGGCGSSGGSDGVDITSVGGNATGAATGVGSNPNPNQPAKKSRKRSKHRDSLHGSNSTPVVARRKSKVCTYIGAHVSIYVSICVLSCLLLVYIRYKSYYNQYNII